MIRADRRRRNREADQTLIAWVTGLFAGIVLSLAFLPIKAPPAPPPPAPKPFWESVMGFHQQADPHQPAGVVVFLGDSITQGLAVQAVSQGALNYSAGGLATADLLNLLPDLKAVQRARMVVLTIGTNDLLRGTPGLEDRLAKISEAIDAPLVWHAIPPSARHDPTEANQAIRQLCARRRQCTYVETAFESSDFRDGVHLNADGYRRWISSLRDAVPGG